MSEYQEIRNQLKSGDIIAFTDAGIFGGWLIRTFTKGPYAHVGVVWKIGDRIFILEDRLRSGVSIRSLSRVGNFDWIPANIEWTRKIERHAISKLQLPYSILNAIALGLKLKPLKGNYVCSLFVADILSIPRDFATPTFVVNWLVERGSKITSVTNNWKRRINTDKSVKE